MTTPAMTVGPEAFLPSAARLLTEAGLRRLYLVDGAGRLIGVASRRDLLSSFLRRDSDIRDEVRADLLRRLDQQRDHPASAPACASCSACRRPPAGRSTPATSWRCVG